jgi:hypothetical protein
MNVRDLFPIPFTGQTTIAESGLTTLDVSCDGMNAFDSNQLLGFYRRMQLRPRPFRIEHGTSVYPRCTFNTDRASFVENGPENYSATLPIKVHGE